MPIIDQEPLTCSVDSVPDFTSLRNSLSQCINADTLEEARNLQKIRLMRSPVEYSQFRDLVSTVGLKTFSRHRRNKCSI